MKLKKIQGEKRTQTKQRAPQTPWITQSQEREGHTGRGGWLICRGRLYASKGRAIMQMQLLQEPVPTCPVKGPGRFCEVLYFAGFFLRCALWTGRNLYGISSLSFHKDKLELVITRSHLTARLPFPWGRAVPMLFPR